MTKRIRIVLVNDFCRAIASSGSIPRKRNESRTNASKKQNNPLRTLSNPAFQFGQHECVNRKPVQVCAGQKCQVRFRRQIRTGKRHFFEVEKEELCQQRCNRQTKRQMKHRLSGIQEREFQRCEHRINR